MRRIYVLLAMIGMTTSAFATTFHSVAIDGINDFSADEVFTTSSSAYGYDAYLTWDAANVYIGFTGADIALADSSRFLQVYIDSDPQLIPTSGTGSTTGLSYLNQKAALPFTANYHFSWSADGSQAGTSTLYTWNGAAWSPFGGPSGSSARISTFVEFSISIADLGNPTQMYIAMFMINSTDGMEWTYAGTPFDAITDGYDPDVLHYLGYNLFSGVAPNTTGHDAMLPNLVFADGFESGDTGAWSASVSDGELGDPCSSGAQCASGFCVDGVCCDETCGGGISFDCQACSVAAGAPAEGTCEPLDGTACDDGLFCTGTDTCQTGSCFGSGDPCPGPDGDLDCAETCEELTDTCSGSDPNGSGCLDDNLFCNGIETCWTGVCVHSGDPCPGPDGDADCSESCEEHSASCRANDPSGSPCLGGNCLMGVCEPGR